MAGLSLIRRFGWLVDYVSADIPSSERERLLRLARHGRKTFLGLKGELQEAIGYNETWRLFVNVTQKELHGSAGLVAGELSKGRHKNALQTSTTALFC